jgi:hypothetical protein
LGLVPGRDFDPSKVVPKLTVVKIMEYFKKVGKPLSGRLFTSKAGLYGTDYLQRVMVPAIGLGANRPQDTVYPTSETDANENKYDSAANKHVIHFDKGQTPPVNGFWSITMYDAKYFFVPNAINRCTVSSRSKFVLNADGSVDIYVQADSPGNGQGSGLAAGSKASVYPDDAVVWPEGDAAFHH